MVKAEVRQQLTEAALALFEERGFDATTVEDIVGRAGVGRTTFFRAFPSKEDVIFPHHDEVVVAVRDRLAAAGPATAELAITEAARLVLRHYLVEGNVARARYRLTSSVPALRHREIAVMQQYQRLFREFAAEQHPGVGGSPLRAELLAGSVVTATNHVLRRWLRDVADDPEREFDAALAEVLDLFREHRAGGDGGAIVVFRTDRRLDAVLPALESLLGPSAR